MLELKKRTHKSYKIIILKKKKKKEITHQALKIHEHIKLEASIVQNIVYKTQSILFYSCWLPWLCRQLVAAGCGQWRLSTVVLAIQGWAGTRLENFGYPNLKKRNSPTPEPELPFGYSKTQMEYPNWFRTGFRVPKKKPNFILILNKH